MSREELIIAKIPKASIGLIDIGIRILDAGVASNLLTINSSLNIREFENSRGIPHASELRSLLSKDKHLDIILKLAEQGFQYKSISRRIGDL